MEIYNGLMPKLPKKKLSLINRAPVQVGTVINPVEIYETLVINTEQLKHLSDGLLAAIKFYEESAVRINKVFEGVIEGQLQIARTLQKVTDALSVFDQINVVITKLSINRFPQIFVQPNQQYQKLKILPQPQRKKQLSLAAVSIEGQGFVLEGQYIKGMTMESKAGKLFQLMLRQDLAGVIPDKLIGETLRADASDYQTWGFVLRDLKEILAGNKLTLDMERYRAISKYKVRSLTRRIRKQRKRKRTVKIGQST